MSNYSRQAKRKNLENKAPRCCGRHMFKNKYGVWQCHKCGRQKFDIETQESGTTSPVVPITAPEAHINETTVIQDAEFEVVE